MDLLKLCLGQDYGLLDPLVKKAHTGSSQLKGRVSVQRGNWLANVICNIFSMPAASKSCALTVVGEHSLDYMSWNRLFDDFAMNSHFEREGQQLVEVLGPIRMNMQLQVSEGALIYRLVKARILGVPIPLWLAPRVIAEEAQVGEVYRFTVNVSMPLVGLLVSYGGDMQLVEA